MTTLPIPSSPEAASMNGEKRRFPRVPMDRPVKLQCQDKLIHIAKLSELSFNGLSLSDCDVKDSRFAIHLCLPQLDEATNKEIVLECRLVHRTPMFSGTCKLGVQFDEIFPSDASLLKQYLSYRLNDYRW